jgi:hypothetical protein
MDYTTLKSRGYMLLCRYSKEICSRGSRAREVTVAYASLHDRAGGAVFVAFDVLDSEGDAGCFGECFVDATVLHR